jgi:proteasome beta subunit
VELTTAKLKYLFFLHNYRGSVHSMDHEIQNNIMKSGTSIVGIVCKDGVVIGGDKRSTAGSQAPIIMSKNSKKVVKVNDYVVVAGTGVASDIDMAQKIFAAELKLKELKTKSRPSVREAANLFGMMTYRNIRTPSMIPSIVGQLIAGLSDDNKAELYSIEPAGGVYEIEDYDANFSSGMPYILGLLERQYKKDITVKEGVELAKECLKSAVARDAASGNGIDIFTVTKDGIKQAVSEEIIAEYK